MKKKSNGVVALIVALLAICGSVYLGYIAAPNVKLGLDLDGGVSITYKSQTANPTAEQMSDAVYKLQLKAQDYSQEAEVYQEGSDRINIDIPGVSDATKILAELGEPGNLYFVEGELTWPLIGTTSEASPSNATGSEARNIPTRSNIIIGEGVELDEETLNALSGVYYDYSANPSFDDSQILLTGNDITSAKAGMRSDARNNVQYVVDLTMSEKGRASFSEATERNIGKPIYIIYNGKLQSAPTVQAKISDGNAQITGMSDLEQAERLASTIRIGALPIQLEELRSNVVGAKLGQDAIKTSLMAGFIGLVIVSVFMMIKYFVPGIAATLALIMYSGLVLFLLDAFGITLTLPGIAGIILSIGMAVDANVIIFSRIKEAIYNGRGTKEAINEGYDKALGAILDGNITTLIAAVVLYAKGTGTIRGFASTLALGIALSIFTALLVTKFILKALYNLGFKSEKLYGKKANKEAIDFVKNGKLFYAISLILIVVGIVGIFINIGSIGGAFNYGLDFKGGSSTNVTFNENLSIDEIDKKVVPIFEIITGSPDIQTQKVTGSNDVIIKTRTLTIEERDRIYKELEAPYSEGGFEVKAEAITTENISGAVSTQMKMDALVAVIISTILMLIYIWFRFKDIRFASAAVLALLHDCLVTIGFYALFKWTVDSTFIACMLTIVGYSINATIIVFDRIRENLIKMKGESIKTIVNTSITQTLSISIDTTITTLIMVVILFVMGVSSVKLFALPLIIGLISGCYSSICLTSNVWFSMKEKAANTSVETNNTTKTKNKKK